MGQAGKKQLLGCFFFVLFYYVLNNTEGHSGLTSLKSRAKSECGWSLIPSTVYGVLRASVYHVEVGKSPCGQIHRMGEALLSF